MKLIDQPRRFAFLWLLLLLLAETAAALQSDLQQPITVEADGMDIDEGRKTNTYQGNVVLHQGTITLKADKVTVIQGSKPGESNRVVAEGNPATLQQLPDGKQEYVVGRANHMEYSVDSETLVLTGNASLRQGQDNFKSDRIVYDRAKAVIRAGASAQGNQRVRVTIGSQSGK
jgi:lipopolysaccharide export system protein LptA